MLEDCVCSINLKIKGGALEERGQCMRRKGKTSSALVLSRKNTQVLVKKPLFKHSYLKYNQLPTGFNLKGRCQGAKEVDKYQNNLQT